MQKIYLLSVLLFVLGVISAHDDVLHTAASWYQEPMFVVTALVAVVALLGLGYGFITKKKQFVSVPTVVLVVAVITGFLSFTSQNDTYEAQLAVADFGAGQSVTLYKSPNCGCCTGHAKALEEAGFAVTIEETNNLDAIKQSHNIPADGASCHTSVIGDYVVEGHVPLEAIEKLLTEKPDVSGIGLPGMPIGTPGMPGPKTAPYEVYQLSEAGEMSPYLTI
jgi:hypothetical protein